MQVEVSRITASVESMILGSSRSSTRTSPALCITTPRITSPHVRIPAVMGRTALGSADTTPRPSHENRPTRSVGGPDGPPRPRNRVDAEPPGDVHGPTTRGPVALTGCHLPPAPGLYAWGHPFDCPDEWWTRSVLDLVGGLKEYFGPGRLQ